MKKFLLLLTVMLGLALSAQATEYAYTFSSKTFSANGEVALGDVNWTLAGDGNYWGYDNQNGKGQQFGSGSSPYKSLTLSTSDIVGTISKITLNTSGASSTNAKLTVSVGGTQYGETISLTKTATDYTFEGSASGEIVISYTQTSSKAIYIKSITVEYTANNNERLVAPTITSDCNFLEKMNVVISANSGTIMYSNGGDYQEYTAPIEISETTTIKTYAKASEEGYADSEVVSATYTKVLPQITESQSYSGTIDVTISCAEFPEAVIYYTTNGDVPTAGSNVYDKANGLTLTGTEDITVKAIAVYDGQTSDAVEATYTYFDPNSVTKYGLVTSADQLVVGNQYLIGDWDSSYALGSQEKNNRKAVEVTKDNDVISIISSDTAVPLELGVGNLEDTYSFYDSSNNGYLYAVSSNSNYLRVEEILSDNSSASITVSDNGVSTIIFKGDKTRNNLRYNSNNGIFSCYSNGQQDVALYSKAIYYIYLNDVAVGGDLVVSVVNADGVALTLCELEEGEWTLEVEDAPATRATTTYTYNKRYAYVPANGQYTIKYSGTDANGEWTPTSMTSNLYFSVAADGTMTGVDEIAVDANAPVEYYNFQGVRVANPEKGMYIRVQGGKATKVILK